MKACLIVCLAAVIPLLQHGALLKRFLPEFQEFSSVTERPTGQAARKLWEQAIGAKGGRDRLLSIKSMVISSRAEYRTHLGKRNSWYQEELLVFPYKQWLWSDMRPNVFGLRVEMYDYKGRRFYILAPDDPDNEIHHLADYKKWEESTLLTTQVLYFMETRWAKPVPIAVSRGDVRKQPVDIVQTQVNGKRMDFALDTTTHLPVRFIVYGMVNGIESPTVVTDLSDYVEVNGIKVPQKVIPEKGSTFSVKIQVDVDYNEEIFLKPTTIEAGPEAWRPKMK